MKQHSHALVFDRPGYRDHEQVIFCADRQSGLRAVIAIHHTRCGAALGGTRMWDYPSVAAALDDALRLSRAMTYKNALAGVPYGGAKAVIIGDPQKAKSDRLIRAYARHVEYLGGRFVTGEDVGITLHDVDVMAEVCHHVRGTSRGRVGNPAPYTALGVLSGIEAAVAHRLNHKALYGVRVCVQGLGSVGMRLCRLLHEAGAALTVCDLSEGLVRQAERQFSATAIAPAVAHTADVDVYAPCALGSILNRRSIPELRAVAVAGSANAQLETPEDGERLRQRGILYAPDYVINAGGVLSIAHDHAGFDAQRLRAHVIDIGRVLKLIFERSDAECVATSTVADRMAQERLDRDSPSLAA